MRALFRLLWAALSVILAAPAAAQAPQPVPLEVYGRLPDIEEVALSPSGRRVALVKVVGEERRLLVLDLAGQVMVNAPIGDVKIAGVSWADDSHLMVTKRETVDGGLDYGWNSYELAAVMVLNVDTRKNFWVFEGRGRAAAVLGNYGVRRIDGKLHGFFGGREDVFTSKALFRVDFATGKATRIRLGDEGRANDWLIGMDGTVVARSEYLSSNGDWDLIVGDTRERIMSRRSTEDVPWLAGFGRTHDTALVLEDTENGRVAMEVALTPGAQPARLGVGLDIAGTLRNSDRVLIGFSTRDHRLHFLDSKHQARWNGAAKAFPGYTLTLVDYTDDLGVMIVHTEGGDDAGTYWLVEVASGGARPLGLTRAAIPSTAVGPTRLVRYKAADGLEMDGVLTLPQGRVAKGLPVIILPHGGPITEADRPGFDWLAQAFASRGYAVFQPNYRGTLGYGEAFSRAAYGEWGAKMQTDLSDGLTELARQGIVDPKRACIVGASYGGYAALAGVTLQQGVYRCAASINGVSNLKAMIDEAADRAGRKSDAVRWWTKLMGVKAGDLGTLAAVSPARQAARADAPVLLVHGRDDTVVAPSQSEEMARELKRASKPVESVVLPGEDHWLSRGSTRQAMLSAVVAFVEKHNPPGAVAP